MDSGGLEDSRNVKVITFPLLEYLKASKNSVWLKYIRVPALQELCLEILDDPQTIVPFLCRLDCIDRTVGRLHSLQTCYCNGIQLKDVASN